MKMIDMQEQIDWTRVARPQNDGYDSHVCLAGAHTRWRHDPHAHRVSDTMLWGAIAVKPLGRRLSTEIEDAPVDHPNLEKIAELVSRWPEGRNAVQSLVDVISPITRPDLEATGTKGSICGHEDCGVDRPLHIVMTVFDVGGGAEAMVHETGHLRLRCLGIDMETHDGGLLTNADDEMYPSPVRFDKLRPMSAVLHGFYSWVMLTQQDLVTARTGDLHLVREFLKTNVPKIRNGLATITEHARWTDEGRVFWDALAAWAEEVIEEGGRHL